VSYTVNKETAATVLPIIDSLKGVGMTAGTTVEIYSLDIVTQAMLDQLAYSLHVWAIDTTDPVGFFASFPPSYTFYDVVKEVLGGAGGSTTSNQTLTGTAGADSLVGGAGKDSLYGGAGDDTLDGGTGADYMEGGSGADTYYVDNAKDTVKESDNTPEGSSGLILQVDIGSTIDAVISSVKYTLTTYVENLTLTGSAKIDGTGNDEGNAITGNSANNKLTGKTGNDSLDGGEGNDTLAGDAGADTLEGGAGADKLTGGIDADIFVLSYLNAVATDADAITDFTEADVLELDATVFAQLDGASSDNLAINKKAADLDSNDYLIYDSKKGILYYDADGSGTDEAAIKIAGIKGTDAKTTFAFDDLSIV
jgi:Ca2+-binding RTX toxin-like protein